MLKVEQIVIGFLFVLPPRRPDTCVLQFDQIDQNVTFEVSVTLTDCSVARPVG